MVEVASAGWPATPALSCTASVEGSDLPLCTLSDAHLEDEVTILSVRVNCLPDVKINNSSTYI